MAKIPLPERGQPLDVSYIYELAQAVNDLSKEMSPATYDYVTVHTPANGPQNRKANEVRVIGAIIKVASSASVIPGTQLPFSHSFAGEFRFPPVITATPVNVGQTPAGANVTVVLNDPSTSSVSGFVKFNASGEASLNINLMIIGIPN
jgi:hypothetical protein